MLGEARGCDRFSVGVLWIAVALIDRLEEVGVLGQVRHWGVNEVLI